MVLHISKKINKAYLETFAKQHYAQCHTLDAHHVLVLGAKYKDVPQDLAPYVLDSYVFDTDHQLASKHYSSVKRSVCVRDLVIGGENATTTLMAGPCSVENEAQLETIAKYLVSKDIKVLRAGCYKPRTSPYSFQGLGKEGLKLLALMRERYGLVIITEARDATHIDDVIAYSDIIQVGSKAMFDQGILRAAAQGGKPVMIKRFFGASLQEFLQASEFILCQGNTEVMLCERGIRSFETKTRFTLDLCSVAYLKQHSNLPIVVDASHAMGYAYGVPDLLRASAAMGIEGLMVEIHPNPPKALSDAQQQLRPQQLSQELNSVDAILKAIQRKRI